MPVLGLVVYLCFAKHLLSTHDMLRQPLSVVQALSHFVPIFWRGWEVQREM